MWNAPNNPIPERYAKAHYLSVIKNSIQDAEEFDIRERKELQEALEYWKERSPLGVKKFQRGLAECNLQALVEAGYFIERLI